MSGRPRWVVVGIDGGCLDRILPLVQRGSLPTIARLIGAGCYTDLRSTVPWQTPVGWSSYATGLNPGAHGVYGWWKPDIIGGELTPSTGSQIQEPRIWELLAAAGQRVGVVNVPMSYPARPINGFHLTGLDSLFTSLDSDPLMCYPPRVKQELARQGIDYRIAPVHVSGLNAAQTLAAWAPVERRHTEAALMLAKEFEPDFLQLNYFIADVVSHRSLPGDEAAASAYEVIDECVGQLLQGLGCDPNVLIVSDHGSAAITHFVMMHSLLHQMGLIKFHPWLADEHINRIVAGQIGGQDVTELRCHLRRDRRLRESMYEELIGQYPGCNIGFSAIDWDATSAYCASDYGQVRINRSRGSGAVTSDRGAAALTQEVQDALMGLTRPDSGEPIVRATIPRDELYSGRYLSDAPEITPLPCSSDVFFCQVYSFYRGLDGAVVRGSSEVVDVGHTGSAGDHQQDGVLVAAGPDVVAHGRISEASILDIAPTLLEAFGAPAHPFHEGVALADLFGRPRPPAPASPPPPSRGEGEITTAELRSRLINLGYKI